MHLNEEVAIGRRVGVPRQPVPHHLEKRLGLDGHALRRGEHELLAPEREDRAQLLTQQRLLEGYEDVRGEVVSGGEEPLVGFEDQDDVDISRDIPGSVVPLALEHKLGAGAHPGDDDDRERAALWEALALLVHRVPVVLEHRFVAAEEVLDGDAELDAQLAVLHPRVENLAVDHVRGHVRDLHGPVILLLLLVVVLLVLLLVALADGAQLPDLLGSLLADPRVAHLERLRELRQIPVIAVIARFQARRGTLVRALHIRQSRQRRVQPQRLEVVGHVIPLDFLERYGALRLPKPRLDSRSHRD
mmetsp:Transcript_9330/g.22878  ORF Transcript_9330/g.22878 Transcript_9330/m.22878 type:complete len:302 (+) Transcript_9330:360-1265(+)